jgi:hypothetical protein
MRQLLLASCFLSLGGCAQFSEFAQPPTPRTPAEMFSGYSYVPLDPLPVEVVIHDSCKGTKLKPLWDFLPDNAVRIAVRQLSGNASLGFGPAKLGYEGNTYQVVLDYINADVSNIRFRASGGDISHGVAPSFLTRVENSNQPSAGNDVVVPVYVGIGLRLTANVTVHKGTVNLSSLGALSAAAEANRVSGSLIVQTLGITGEKVTGALPLPSELNPTTIQNAMQALGSIKAIIYDDKTILYPRVTGIYDPLPNSNQETINQVVSELSRERVKFEKTCPAEPEQVTKSTPAPKKKAVARKSPHKKRPPARKKKERGPEREYGN